jgi:hypothetical protein
MNIVVKAANKMTDLKNEIKMSVIEFKNNIKAFAYKTINYGKNNPGISILIAALLLGILTNSPWTYYFWGSILYIFVLINRKMQYQKEKDKLAIIDINKLNDGPDGLKTILTSFVSDCFDRDVLFFRGLQDKEYINTKDEQEMLNSLLESVASNMSPSLRTKLDMYYGYGRTDIIIGRICYQLVSLFVANNNKQIYPNSSKIPNMN